MAVKEVSDEKDAMEKKYKELLATKDKELEAKEKELEELRKS